ncbi:YtxH domain-containing protein [Bizionia argentinensis JUB59]|uniref:YtxH domain-containing protein n=1 Tax=Bizionia argentinensis JUB59 TaxID=1046627 RepID=G2EB51_9FLAO|nr:YtxH domain-containing protein [Bizionia argentinensis]EGV44264.1 YtxH domain-containing protein [Bizionia argentinensis JUB59]
MNNSGSTALGVLAGATIGAVLGILFAPDKGSVTRQRISDEAESQKAKMASSASELRDRVVATVSAEKHTLEDRVESIVSDVSYKADDVITTLEAKLKDLKDKNKKLQKS